MNNTVLFGLCILLLVGSNLWFFLRVLRPLRNLALQAEQIRQGDFDALKYDCGGIPEIGALQRAMAGMTGHVRRSQEQRHAYTDRLAEGQESERKRIAHELHDETLQSLIAVNQSIDLARGWIQTDPARAAKMLQLAREQVLESATGLRSLIGGLRPPALEELGLVAALEMETKKITDLSVAISVEGVQRRLDEAHELALFRAAQELLTNVRRHSRAHEVKVRVRYRPDGIALRVSDDGCGFSPPPQLDDLASHYHYGLIGLQERLHNLGGSVRIDSGSGQGTTVEVFLPTKESIQPDRLVRDPVCSAVLEPQQAYSSLKYEGETYYFCCPVCQGAFQKDPELYLTPSLKRDNKSLSLN